MKLDTVREDKAILTLTSRLAESFAEIHTPEDVEAAVRAAHQRFTGDPVRDYVPILVERIVREELAPQPELTASEDPAERMAKWTRAVSIETMPEGHASTDDETAAGGDGPGTGGTTTAVGPADRAAGSRPHCRRLSPVCSWSPPSRPW